MKRAILVLVISLVSVQGFSQTIADVARRERARRSETTETGNVITGRGSVITLTAKNGASGDDIGAESDDVFKYYDIKAGTAAEIRAEISKLGPSSNGVRHQAETKTSITWRPLVGSAPGGKCIVTGINLTMTIEIVFPRWVNEVGAPQSLSDSWRNFLRGLLMHEHGHKQISIENAEELRKLVKGATPQANCDAAGAAFNAAAKVVNEAAEKKQDDYDKATDHGRLQGVRLP
jgi:predicted secreted Zn-dependent protease